jgi:putative polyhydroxyalkanoate system protein
MADIQIHRKHALGLAKAKTVANKVAKDLETKYELESAWEGNTLTFSRAGVQGELSVTKDEMNCEVTLGFLFKAFKGPIQGEMEKNFDRLLKAKA